MEKEEEKQIDSFGTLRRMNGWFNGDFSQKTYRNWGSEFRLSHSFMYLFVAKRRVRKVDGKGYLPPSYVTKLFCVVPRSWSTFGYIPYEIKSKDVPPKEFIFDLVLKGWNIPDHFDDGIDLDVVNLKGSLLHIARFRWKLKEGSSDWNILKERKYVE